MNSYAILIGLSLAVILSYLFNLASRATRVPSVLLLLLTGIGLRQWAEYQDVNIHVPKVMLEIFGIIGLIMIVLEGALDLRLTRDKVPLIRRSFLAALVMLMAQAAAIGGLLHLWLGASWQTSLLNAVPLVVISSAIAIPSVANLTGEKQEFIVYESTFSDILGIMLFNFVDQEDFLQGHSLITFGRGVVLIVLVAIVSTALLSFLLGRLREHVKFFLLFSFLILMYSLAKQLHLSSLLLVLAFGLAVNNADLLLGWVRLRTNWRGFTAEDLAPDLHQLKNITAESAFLIRTFFFLLTGLRGVLERGLSPSALNEYLACSLKFYFSRLAKFRENDEVEEALGADGFGTVVHDSLEQLLKPFELAQREFTTADLPEILKKVPAEVHRQLRQEGEERQARPDDGLNHVLGQVATRLIRKYLESLPDQPGVLPLRIAAQEKPMVATVFVDLPGRAKQLPVRILGRADRIDALPDGRRRVVDYKTGLVERRELNLRGTQKPLSPTDTVERLLTESSSGADKVRQLWLYRFMLESDPTHPAPPGSEAAILSLRKIDDGLLSAPLDFITEGTGEADFLQASAVLVSRLALRMLDPAEPIRKTDDLTKCAYCPYTGICAR
jgi:hypothetical protein